VEYLKIENLTKTFGGVVAVDHVSFSVEQGSLVGIMEIGRASCRERV
jgi:ABC-type multidrug transport system ATPase subunit